MRLKTRRAVFHMILGIFIIAVSFFYDIKWFLFYILIFGILLSLFSLKYKIPFIWFMLKKFEKPVYIKIFPGKSAAFFIAACLLVLKIFQKEIALASIAVLTFADPAASFFGEMGKIKYKKFFSKMKTLEGSIIGFFVAILACSFFVPFFHAIAAAAVAMITEALTLKLGGDNVDDNITVPMAVALVLSLF